MEAQSATTQISYEVSAAADLPDAPQPNSDIRRPQPAEEEQSSSSVIPGDNPGVMPAKLKTYVPLKDCPYDKTHAKECSVHWRQLFISSAVFITFQNTGNLYTAYSYRYETTTGNWWERYFDSVEGWRWTRWADNNPFLDDYVGHTMMGGITSFLWIQNDPKGMTLVQSNTWPYWRSRLRALAFSAAYSTEWKLGPIGEAGFGHNGDHYFYDDGVYTNETGWVELITTPVGGMLWTMAEDTLDRFVITRLENASRNPFLLLSYQFLNPARGTANILRFRPPWYRDSRVVKANSFWSDPVHTTYVTSTSPNLAPAATPATTSSSPVRETKSAETATANTNPHGPPSVTVVQTKLPSNFAYPGGVHEFGGWWGLSLMSGHLWGDAGDVKFMPIDVRYSYLMTMHPNWALRYSPEVTALAMLDEPVPGQTNPQLLRKRTYGSGISPEGFQFDFRPERRVQPFFSQDAGFIYFFDRVLSPQGSQLMIISDFGAGVNIFRRERQVVTIGYRYQHLGNGGISAQNPGTDANTFYVGVSRFRTKKPKLHSH